MGKTQFLGRSAEQYAEKYLQSQGLIFMERNYQTRYGEIDLIMQDKQYLVFIEVRLRNNPMVSALESVSFFKQQKIIRAAEAYLKKYRASHLQHCRFDVLALQQTAEGFIGHWIKNAFEVI